MGAGRRVVRRAPVGTLTGRAAPPRRGPCDQSTHFPSPPPAPGFCRRAGLPTAQNSAKPGLPFAGGRAFRMPSRCSSHPQRPTAPTTMRHIAGPSLVPGGHPGGQRPWSVAAGPRAKLINDNRNVRRLQRGAAGDGRRYVAGSSSRGRTGPPVVSRPSLSGATSPILYATGKFRTIGVPGRSINNRQIGTHIERLDVALLRRRSRSGEKRRLSGRRRRTVRYAT